MKSLKEQIAEYDAEKVKQVPADILEIMDQATNHLKDSKLENNALKTQDIAPEFSLPNQKNEQQSLRSLLSQSAIVLSFYRGGWCPYCNLELYALQQILPEIEAYGAKLIAISPEVPDHSLSTQEKNNLTFDILYDKGNQLAKQFGLVFTLAEELRPIYDKFDLDIPDHNGDDSFELPMPATYIISQSGRIHYHFINADYTQRSEPVEVLKHLQSLYAE